jgi:hypothetical protein
MLMPDSAVLGLGACWRGEPATAEDKAVGARLVFKDKAGRELTNDDLKKASGNVRWEIIGTVGVPSEARRLHEEGRVAGSRGDYPRSLDFFLQARRLAPDWPYPVYDAAFSYLLQATRPTQRSTTRRWIAWRRVASSPPRHLSTA